MTGKTVFRAALLWTSSGCELPGPAPRPDVRYAVGHRGAPFVHAENTIPSFKSAAKLGANAVEVDLSITSDDHVILWHNVDPTFRERFPSQVAHRSLESAQAQKCSAARMRTRRTNAKSRPSRDKLRTVSPRG